MSGPGDITTSGSSYGFNPVATQIITEALLILAVINEDETPTAGMYKRGLNALNSMVKEWEADGIHVWTEEEAILFLQQGQSRYLIGAGSNCHCTDANSYLLGELASSAASGAGTVTVLDATGLTTGMKFGVTLDSGATFWTTINGAPSGNIVTLAAVLTGSASAQNITFAYTTDIIRPLKIPAARRFQYNGLIITPLTPMLSRQEYMDLPQIANPGLVNQCFYNPGGAQTGELLVWNVPSDSSMGLRFTWYRPIQDFTTVDDAPDLPQEWANALQWGLAMELAPRYSVPPERYDRISTMAAAKKELVQGWDREPQNIYFQLSYDTTAAR